MELASRRRKRSGGFESPGGMANPAKTRIPSMMRCRKPRDIFEPKKGFEEQRFRGFDALVLPRGPRGVVGSSDEANQASAATPKLFGWRQGNAGGPEQMVKAPDPSGSTVADTGSGPKRPQRNGSQRKPLRRKQAGDGTARQQPTLFQFPSFLGAAQKSLQHGASENAPPMAQVQWSPCGKAGFTAVKAHPAWIGNTAGRDSGGMRYASELTFSLEDSPVRRSSWALGKEDSWARRRDSLGEGREDIGMVKICASREGEARPTASAAAGYNMKAAGGRARDYNMVDSGNARFSFAHPTQKGGDSSRQQLPERAGDAAMCLSSPPSLAPSSRHNAPPLCSPPAASSTSSRFGWAALSTPRMALTCGRAKLASDASGGGAGIQYWGCRAPACSSHQVPSPVVTIRALSPSMAPPLAALTPVLHQACSSRGRGSIASSSGFTPEPAAPAADHAALSMVAFHSPRSCQRTRDRLRRTGCSCAVRLDFGSNAADAVALPTTGPGSCRDAVGDAGADVGMHGFGAELVGMDLDAQITKDMQVLSLS